MSDIQTTEGILEVQPEAVLHEMARVLEAAIPGLSLIPRLGDPRPISTLFDADERDVADAALLAKDQEIRSLGMWIALNGESWGGGDLTSSDATPQRWVGFARQVLSDIQDIISRATTNPWPEIRIDGRRTHASVGAALEGRFLRMWYGDREHPAVMFEPVEVIKEASDDAG